MRVAVDISLYPLHDGYIPPIKGFIEALLTYPDLRVERNAMSTQVSGDIDAVFAALRTEIGRTFEAEHRSAVVMKMLGGGN